MTPDPRLVALIPARAGSKRVTGKNVRPLDGHPLLAYAIASARASGAFSRIIVSTDSEEFAAVARAYGAEAPFLRPAALAGDLSPDIEWVRHALGELRAAGDTPDAYALLRPTSPFRQAVTIQRAVREFLASSADSLRAVQKVSEHPGKMWVRRGPYMTPLLPFASNGTRWQSTPYQGLPEVFVQNASLEIAWTKTALEKGTLEGDLVHPFLTQGYEGFDINDELDWELAVHLITTGKATLPHVGGKI